MRPTALRHSAAGRISGTADSGLTVTALTIVALIGAHAVLAILLRTYPVLGFAHAMAMLAAGCGLALRKRDKFPVAAVCAYITGAEVLWRMTKAPLFWEFGKYAMVLLIVCSLVNGHAWQRRSRLMLWYLVLLIPGSLVMLMGEPDLATLKDRLSFNLSGPLSLVMAVVFFSGLRLTSAQLGSLMICLLLPAVSIATLALTGTLQAEDLSFRDSSSFATSGGFGPNQVSAALALGCVACFLYVIVCRTGLIQRAMLFILMGTFAVQSALTFSRSGVYMAGCSIALALLYAIRAPRARAAAVVVTLGITALVVAMVPRLDAFTGGAFSERYGSANTSSRVDLAVEELEIWQDNWFLGVGPGGLAEERTIGSNPIAAHTEFTRLLAEHGLFGLGSIIVLALVIGDAIRRQRDPTMRGVVAAMAFFALLFMTASAMRTTAPAFALGLACATLIPDPTGARPATMRRQGWGVTLRGAGEPSPARGGGTHGPNQPRITLAHERSRRR